MKWLKLKSEWKKNEAGKILSFENDIQAKTLIEADIAEETADPTTDVVAEAGKKFTENIKSMVADGVKSAVDALAKSSGGKGGRPPIGEITTHDNALDDPKLGFKSGGEFWHTWVKAQKGDDVAKKRLFGDDGYVKKMEVWTKATGQSDAIDSEGGIFIMPEFSNELLMTQAQLASLRRFCRQFNMQGTSYSIRARVDKNHQTSVAGGINVSRKFEGVPADKQKASFEWVTFKPTKLTGYCAITDELMEDAPAFASLFPQFFAEAMDGQEESDILVGGGTGEPLGAFATTNPSRLTVNKDTSQPAATLSVTNIFNMRKACWGYSSAVWVANQDIIPQLATFVIGTVPVFQPSMKEDVADTLLGRPILWSEYCETLGTQGDIRLGNFREYGLADRGGLNSATSMHVKFLEGEQLIKYWKRGDGQPLWRSPLTPVKGSQRSPFVDLQAR